MWPRILELIIACWLASSPFVFSHFDENRSLWLNDFICAGLIAACALLSFSTPWRRLHLAELPVAAWLLGFGYMASTEPWPALQNNILVALVVMMVAIIPSEANQPPRAWREFSNETRTEKQ